VEAEKIHTRDAENHASLPSGNRRRIGSLRVLPHFSAETGLALHMRPVPSVWIGSIRPLAVALLAGALTISGSPISGLANRHEACAPKHHACGATVTRAGCCCGHADESPNSTNKPEPQTSDRDGSSYRAVTPPTEPLNAASGSCADVRTAKQLHALDLPTLFSDLRL
jgi:hypothetical protein